MNLSAEVISKATGSTLQNAEKYRPYLNKYMSKYGINTPLRVMAFLSQIGVESDALTTTEEYHDGSNYEGKVDLGNIYAGDGVKFKGRGLIQITGRANYQDIQDKLGLKVIDNPKLLEQPDYATEVSAWWWANRVRQGKNLNQWADMLSPTDSIYSGNNAYVFEQITRAINGGVNGLQERSQKFEKAQSEYDNIKKMVFGWFTTWWGLSIIGLVMIGGSYLIIRNIKKGK
jgi:putative chitinase